MPETTSYTLTGQADLVGTLRRLLAEHDPIRWRYPIFPVAALIGHMAQRQSPIGTLMRELHALGRLDGFKVRRGASR